MMMPLVNNEMENKKSPLLVVVMGVSGCGKSTLAQEVASHFDVTFLDADSFHSEDAIKQMSAGTPLTDAQRVPWIARICMQLRHFEMQNKSCVLAYSGLKQQHRQLIFASYHRAVGILLKAEQSLIAQRLADRGGHFMSPQLLASQVAAMEPINAEPALEQIKLLTLSATETVERLLSESVDYINTI